MATKKDTPPPGPVQNETAKDQTLLGTAQQPQSLSSGIDQLMGQYVNEMSQLGPEYSKELEYLAPYLTGSNNQSFQDILNTSKENESPTGDKAVAAADTAAGNATLGENAPGFGNLAGATKQYEGQLTSGGPIQASLAYQKYLQTYGGLPSTSIPSSISQYITGTTGTAQGGSGLPSPAAAGAQATATANATNVSTDLGASSTGGGNAS